MVDNRTLSGSGVNWFVLSTRSNSEFTVADKVTDIGYKTFVPVEGRYRRPSRYASTKRLAHYPLIPSYVFFGVGPGREARWFDLLSMDPVLGVVSWNGRPAMVRPGAVESLMDRQANHEFDAPDCQKFMKSGHEFAVGDACEITAGPFRGHEVTVQKIKGNAASVLMELFTREQTVKISLDLLSLKI